MVKLRAPGDSLSISCKVSELGSRPAHSIHIKLYTHAERKELERITQRRRLKMKIRAHTENKEKERRRLHAAV